jgi:hypothetical protein
MKINRIELNRMKLNAILKTNQNQNLFISFCTKIVIEQYRSYLHLKHETQHSRGVVIHMLSITFCIIMLYVVMICDIILTAIGLTAIGLTVVGLTVVGLTVVGLTVVGLTVIGLIVVAL